MPGEASNVGSDIGLDAITGRATQTARTMYFALLDTAPTDTTTMATMSEIETPGSNGYDREIAAWDAPAGDPPETQNSALITFGPFTADLPAVSHIALVSAATGTSGDLVAHWAVDVTKDPANGDSITIAAGAVTLSLD